MQTELKLTEDGSHTLFVPGIDECYHSTHGAIQESRHIFIEAGLRQCLKPAISMLEIGFGTGLNAFLTLLETAQGSRHIHYTTLELYPVEIEKALQLNYPEVLAPDKKSLFNKLHTSPWNEEAEITPDFLLKKVKTDFTKYIFEENFDVVFFDAFSPEKQPEMWSKELFSTIYNHCNPGAILTTYCAKGVVRRAMQEAGFTVVRLPGPPGKREMLKSLKVCRG